MHVMKNIRVTMKDVAKEAGVSTATVSYVLNYSNTERISHETRMRVFEAVNKLKYVPNMTAKSLASKRSFLVAIIINMEENNKRSKLYQYFDLASEIQKRLNLMGYDAIFLPTKKITHDIVMSRQRSLDAVFIMDMKEELLKEITNQFFVPVIFIDGFIGDPIFCKILTEWDAVFKRATEQLGENFYVVMEDYANKSLWRNVTKRISEEDVFINCQGNNLAEFLHMHKDGKGLIIGEELGMQAEHYVDNRNISVVVHHDQNLMLLPDMKVIVVSNKEKAEAAVRVMKELLDLEQVTQIQNITYIGVR